MYLRRAFKTVNKRIRNRKIKVNKPFIRKARDAAIKRQLKKLAVLGSFSLEAKRQQRNWERKIAANKIKYFWKFHQRRRGLQRVLDRKSKVASGFHKWQQQYK
jgi:hypothetical protein